MVRQDGGYRVVWHPEVRPRHARERKNKVSVGVAVGVAVAVVVGVVVAVVGGDVVGVAVGVAVGMTEDLVSLLRDPARFSHAIVKRGEAWADAESAAALLEETRKSVLASQMVGHGDIPVSKAEMHALASPVYRQHVEAMVEARRAANKARVAYDGARAMMELARSAEATRRIEMGIR